MGDKPAPLQGFDDDLGVDLAALMHLDVEVIHHLCAAFGALRDAYEINDGDAVDKSIMQAMRSTRQAMVEILTAEAVPDADDDADDDDDDDDDDDHLGGRQQPN